MNTISPEKHTVLILGASGFIGNVLYKELLSYFKIYGTYCRQEGNFKDNHVFFKYDVTENNLDEILSQTNPSVIISALRGDFKAQFEAHQLMVNYVKQHHESRIIYLSSVHVFDGLFKFPKYENDTPKSETHYGHHKLAIEQLLLNTVPAQTTIARLPIVLGVNAPRITQLIQASRHKAAFEVFPNLIVSVTTADKIAQQLHYIINQGLEGIFHLASDDVIHHEDLYSEICSKLGEEVPVFKRVFHRNEETYLAILPKINVLPSPYQITVSEVIDFCTLKEEISTFKL